MNALKKKLNKNGGFTLVEMLIVVAIIAVLIAVSIPMVNSALEKANDATDQANERAAKALATIALADSKTLPDGVDMPTTDESGKNTAVVYYNASEGKFVDSKAVAKVGKAYGKCTNGAHDDSPFIKSSDTGGHTGKVIEVTFTYASNGSIDIAYEWVPPTE